MQGAVTVSMAASPEQVWDLITDVRNIGKFSPEVFEAEWLDGATGPALGARFRGHVRRNEIGPVYWTTCRVTACEPGREFGFEVLLGDRAVNNWHYRLSPAGAGTDVTESFRLSQSPLMAVYSVLGGQLRRRRNLRDMRKTLERIKAAVEGGARQ
ncbi:SRPBCC family protein [Mycolicibacterium iranicum]|uniref:Cyclase n=1 Tax=Mycolicibacterium iranicum TaxID=912594 RepID=A0A178LQK5_MYCIR|nr:SRPBCC family protein [Mycolicibacterium iranicum]OAN35789.1 cyclase [Mycolicibacterium iranicum]